MRTRRRNACASRTARCLIHQRSPAVLVPNVSRTMRLTSASTTGSSDLFVCCSGCSTPGRNAATSQPIPAVHREETSYATASSSSCGSKKCGTADDTGSADGARGASQGATELLRWSPAEPGSLSGRRVMGPIVPTQMTKGAVIGDRVLRNVISNWIGKVLWLCSGFLLIPFILDRVGTVQFGLWALASSVMSYGLLLDFGIGWRSEER